MNHLHLLLFSFLLIYLHWMTNTLKFINNLMSQITIINILDKIRSICKDCHFSILPDRASSQSHVPDLEGYLKVLQAISLQDQYNKLEQLLQHQETEIRKRISIENQLKLYADTLNAQIEDLERDKIDLLQNTKAYIKQLKQANQNLFIQLNLEIKKGKQASSEKSHQKSISKSRQKTQSKLSRFNFSHSHHKSKCNRSIKEIIKTQYIQRQSSPSRKKDDRSRKVVGQHSKRQIHETISDTEGQQIMAVRQNSRTEHIIRNSNSKKQKGSHLASKKKANHVFSNPNFFNFFDNAQKKPIKTKTQKKLFGKSPTKAESKEKKQIMKSRLKNPSRCQWKQKQLNRSVFSVLSMDHPPNKKETI